MLFSYTIIMLFIFNIIFYFYSLYIYIHIHLLCKNCIYLLFSMFNSGMKLRDLENIKYQCSRTQSIIAKRKRNCVCEEYLYSKTMFWFERKINVMDMYLCACVSGKKYHLNVLSWFTCLNLRQTIFRFNLQQMFSLYFVC